MNLKKNKDVLETLTAALYNTINPPALSHLWYPNMHYENPNISYMRSVFRPLKNFIVLQ